MMRGLLGAIAALAAALCSLTAARAQSGPALPLSTQPFRSTNGPSYPLSMTSDSRYVLIRSDASNLVSGDTNQVTDLFVVDATLRSVSRVTVRTTLAGGTVQANGPTYRGMIADTGAVVIETWATNLGGVSDTNNARDILYRAPNQTTWLYLSTNANGVPVGGLDPFISRDGRWAAWVQGNQIWLFNTSTQQKVALPMSQIVGAPIRQDSLRLLGLSSEGQFLLFAADVQSGNLWNTRLLWYNRDADANGVYDDQVAPAQVVEGFNRQVSLTGVMSTDGRTVAYTVADDLSRIIHYHVISQRRTFLSTGVMDSPAFHITDDGRYVAHLFMGNQSSGEIRLWDSETDTSRIVSVDYRGVERVVQIPTAVLVSDTGTRVVFSATDNSGWVPGDTNRLADVLVRDLDEGRTYGLTTGPGTLNDGAAGSVHIDGTGSRAVFASTASNLVTGDTNGKTDVFIRFADGTLRRIVAHDGAEPNDSSFDPKISSDGRWVVFCSRATNLTPEGGNGKVQIYLYDIATNQIRLLSRTAAGQPGNADSDSPSISRDGTFVAFASAASNLVSGDTNNQIDVFFYTRSSGSLTRIVPRDGGQPNGASGNPVISDDGAVIAFVSRATNLVSGDTNGKDDIFVYYRAGGWIYQARNRGTIQLNGHSYQPSISQNGRYVAFATEATNIDPRDTDTLPDIYLWDSSTGTMTLVSVNSFGRKANLGGRMPSISLDGGRVAFESDATNLTPLDLVPDTDIFVYDHSRGWVYPISLRGCVPGGLPSFIPALSGDGRVVAFQTNAANLSDLPTGANAYAALQRVVCTPPGDVNRDGQVDDADLLLVLFDFGQESSCADVTMDGVVDDADLLVVLFNFGAQCNSAGFLRGDDDEYRRLLEALGDESANAWGYTDESGYHYHATLMTPARLKSLERQAAEIEMLHQGRWPYPVAGRGSEPWIAAYGDPLAMSEEELKALLDQFHNPPQQEEGDFSPASGFIYDFRRTTSLRLGTDDVNISVNGSFWLSVSCDFAFADARGEASIKFFPLNLRIAEADAFAGTFSWGGSRLARVYAYFKIAGRTLWSYSVDSPVSFTYASRCRYGRGGPDLSWSREFAFSQTFWVGPIPLTVRAGINLTAGACYKFELGLVPPRAEARFRPYVESTAFASGAIGGDFLICSAEAGVRVGLTLLNNDLEAYAVGQIGRDSRGCYAELTAGVQHQIEALSGYLQLYGRVGCWFLSFSGAVDLFRWHGFRTSGDILGPFNFRHYFK
jgi:hypothetical protein